MNAYGRLIHGRGNSSDRATTYALVKSETIIGRSQSCDIQLTDPHISRRQARIFREDDRVFLESLGGNPVLVNEEPTERTELHDGDMILLGRTLLVFRHESLVDLFGDPLHEDFSPELENTVFLQTPAAEREQGPRLVVLDPDGESRVYLIGRKALTLGRSQQTDVCLADASVSRNHARIENRGDGFHVVKLSETSPLTVNRRNVTDERLYAGDEMQIGPFRVSFVSDRREDRREIEEGTLLKGPKASKLIGMTLLLALIVAGSYLGYQHTFLPWKMNRQLDALALKGTSGPEAEDQQTLELLLAKPLPAETRGKALQLLARSIIAQVDQLVPEGKFVEARTILAGFLSKYGADKESELVQARLDQLRLQFGQQLEIGGDPTAALREFSSIAEGSPFHEEAQRALTHIWRPYQKENVTELPIDQLMAEADAHFAARRYTTPIGKNAYAIYQTILALDPNNTVARDRIEQMKSFYRNTGVKYFQRRNCDAALGYFEKVLLISPDDDVIREMVHSCKKGRAFGNRRRTTRRASTSESTSQEPSGGMHQDPEAERPSEAPR